MGTPVPPDWPDLVDDTTYVVTEDAFYAVLPEPLCSVGYIDRRQCNKTGAQINLWYENVGDCQIGLPLCFPRPGDCYRIICIEEL